MGRNGGKDTGVPYKSHSQHWPELSWRGEASIVDKLHSTCNKDVLVAFYYGIENNPPCTFVGRFDRKTLNPWYYQLYVISRPVCYFLGTDEMLSLASNIMLALFVISVGGYLIMCANYHTF